MRMKKRYVPPMIAIEHYELTQAIASCDRIKIGFLDSSCVIKDPDATSDMKSLAHGQFYLSGCSYESFGMDPNDGPCYHTAAGAFSS